MIALLIVIHIIVSILLVLAVLSQSGQAGGLSGAFGAGGGGGGGSQSLFGGRGAASFLSKATAYLGSAFLVVSFVLAFAQAHRSTGSDGGNVIQDIMNQAPPPATAPVTGGENPAQFPEGITPIEMPAEEPTEPASDEPSGGGE